MMHYRYANTSAIAIVRRFSVAGTSERWGSGVGACAQRFSRVGARERWGSDAGAREWWYSHAGRRSI